MFGRVDPAERMYQTQMNQFATQLRQLDTDWNGKSAEMQANNVDMSEQISEYEQYMDKYRNIVMQRQNRERMRIQMQQTKAKTPQERMKFQQEMMGLHQKFSRETNELNQRRTTTISQMRQAFAAAEAKKESLQPDLLLDSEMPEGTHENRIQDLFWIPRRFAPDVGDFVISTGRVNSSSEPATVVWWRLDMELDPVKPRFEPYYVFDNFIPQRETIRCSSRSPREPLFACLVHDDSPEENGPPSNLYVFNMQSTQLEAKIAVPIVVDVMIFDKDNADVIYIAKDRQISRVVVSSGEIDVVVEGLESDVMNLFGLPGGLIVVQTRDNNLLIFHIATQELIPWEVNELTSETKDTIGKLQWYFDEQNEIWVYEMPKEVGDEPLRVYKLSFEYDDDGATDGNQMQLVFDLGEWLKQLGHADLERNLSDAGFDTVASLQTLEPDDAGGLHIPQDVMKKILDAACNPDSFSKAMSPAPEAQDDTLSFPDLRRKPTKSMVRLSSTTQGYIGHPQPSASLSKNILVTTHRQKYMEGEPLVFDGKFPSQRLVFRAFQILEEEILPGVPETKAVQLKLIGDTGPFVPADHQSTSSRFQAFRKIHLDVIPSRDDSNDFWFGVVARDNMDVRPQLRVLDLKTMQDVHNKKLVLERRKENSAALQRLNQPTEFPLSQASVQAELTRQTQSMCLWINMWNLGVLDPIANMAEPILQQLLDQKWVYEELFVEVRRDEAIAFFQLNLLGLHVIERITEYNPDDEKEDDVDVENASRRDVLLSRSDSMSIIQNVSGDEALVLLLTEARRVQKHVFNISEQLDDMFKNVHKIGNPGAKKPERAIEKVVMNYLQKTRDTPVLTAPEFETNIFVEYSDLKDLARVGVVCDSFGDMHAALSQLVRWHDDGVIKIVRIKNRFDPSYSCMNGYRDILLNIQLVNWESKFKVPLPTDDGNEADSAVENKEAEEERFAIETEKIVSDHIVEVQLYHKKFYEIRTSDGGHANYKATRFLVDFLLEMGATERTANYHDAYVGHEYVRRQSMATIRPSGARDRLMQLVSELLSD